MLTMTSFVHGVTSITLTDPEIRASQYGAWGTRKLTIHTDTGVIEINLFAANTEPLVLACERTEEPSNA